MTGRMNLSRKKGLYGSLVTLNTQTVVGGRIDELDGCIAALLGWIAKLL